MTHRYTCDSENRLRILAANKQGGTGLASYTYTLDAAGHRKSVTELSGRTVNYGYDNIYHLTSETIASDPNAINGVVGYTYDNVGNRTQAGGPRLGCERVPHSLPCGQGWGCGR